jgi:hypothetical protein
MNNIYNVLPKWKWLSILLSALVLGVFFNLLYYLRYGEDIIGIYIMSGLAIVLSIILRLIFKKTVLFVFDDGIKYLDSGRVIYATWSQLTEIQTQSYWLFWKSEGVFVLKPESHEIPVPWLVRPDSLESPVKTRQSALIPLSLFFCDWRKSVVGEKIKRHAPHLFDKNNS